MNTNSVFRLVYPVNDMNTFAFKLNFSENRLDMNRIPCFVLRSAYSTSRFPTHPSRRGVHDHGEGGGDYTPPSVNSRPGSFAHAHSHGETRS